MTISHGRFGLLEDTVNFRVYVRPVDPQQPPRLLLPRERAVAALLGACELLMRRGPEPGAWTTPFRQDPVAFLLDSMNDAVTLWGPDGVIVYNNRAAEEIGCGRCEDVALKDFVNAGRRYQRRCIRIEHETVEYVLEVLHEVPQ